MIDIDDIGHICRTCGVRSSKSKSEHIAVGRSLRVKAAGHRALSTQRRALLTQRRAFLVQCRAARAHRDFELDVEFEKAEDDWKYFGECDSGVLHQSEAVAQLVGAVWQPCICVYSCVSVESSATLRRPYAVT